MTQFTEELDFLSSGDLEWIMGNPHAKPRPRVVSLRDDPIGKMAKLGRLGLNADRDVRLMAVRKAAARLSFP